MRTRILSFFLMLLLCFSLFGCEKIDLSGGKNSDRPDRQGDSSVLTVKTTVSGEFSFRPDAGSSVRAEAILARFAEAERLCGCTVSVEVISKKTLSAAFLQATRAEKRYADLIQTDAGLITAAYAEGRILSLDEAGLSPSSVGVLRSGDTAYALRADGWNNPLPSASYLMFFNATLLSDLGCEDPSELYENGLWNWNSFLSVAEQVTQMTGDGEIYALSEPTENDKTLMWATLYAAGATWFDPDGNCVMDSPAAKDGFAKLKELSDRRLLYRLLSEEHDTADATAKQAFTNRRTGFLVGNASLIYETGEDSVSERIGESLRMICFPTIPGGRENTVAFTEEDLFCAVPQYANTDLCAKVLPILFAAPDGTDPEEERKDTYFFSDTDADRFTQWLTDAGTDTRMLFGDDRREPAEEYLFSVVRGSSATEMLSNLQLIFNEMKGID